MKKTPFMMEHPRKEKSKAIRFDSKPILFWHLDRNASDTSTNNKIDGYISSKKKVQVRSESRNRRHSLLKDIRKMYAVPDFLDLMIFLKKHPNLISFALIAAKEVRKYFPSEKLSLEAVVDPETAEEELIAYIYTSHSVEDSLQRLDKFDDEWFLDQIDHTNKSFGFNLRFI